MSFIHVHRTPLKEIHREPLSARWCFTCRTRAGFLYLVHTTVEPSYYDPTPSIRCGTCGAVDGDIFPGCGREWSE